MKLSSSFLALVFCIFSGVGKIFAINKNSTETCSRIQKDTIKRNEFTVYKVEKDTLLDNGLRLIIANENIPGKYVVQYLDFGSVVVANYYADVKSSIKVLKGDKVIFDNVFTKNTLPEIPIFKLLNKSIYKGAKFLYDSKDQIIIQSTVYVPNTDWSYDFQTTINSTGKSDTKWIDYEAE